MAGRLARTAGRAAHWMLLGCRLAHALTALVLCADNRPWVLDGTWCNRAHYAAQHGYEVANEGFTGRTVQQRRPANRQTRASATLFKPYAILDRMRESAERVEWILWLDSDARIVNFDVPLDTFIRDSHPDAELILPREHANLCVFSNFALLIKNTPRMRRMVEFWASLDVVCGWDDQVNLYRAMVWQATNHTYYEQSWRDGYDAVRKIPRAPVCMWWVRWFDRVLAANGATCSSQGLPVDWQTPSGTVFHFTSFFRAGALRHPGAAGLGGLAVQCRGAPAPLQQWAEGNAFALHADKVASKVFFNSLRPAESRGTYGKARSPEPVMQRPSRGSTSTAAIERALAACGEQERALNSSRQLSCSRPGALNRPLD